MVQLLWLILWLCSVANVSIDLLKESNWKKVKNIEEIFSFELEKYKNCELVKDARNIGAIGIIELKEDCYAQEIQDYCVKKEFGLDLWRLIYSIVAYTIEEKDLRKIVNTMCEAINSIKKDRWKRII